MTINNSVVPRLPVLAMTLSRRLAFGGEPVTVCDLG
jgi:hypothetical protein